MTAAAAPFLPETADGGGDLPDPAAAGAPSGRRRLAPTAGMGPGINVGAGPRARAGEAAGIRIEGGGRSVCFGVAILIGMVGGAAFAAVARFEVAVQIKSGVRTGVGATVVGLAGGAVVRAGGGAPAGAAGGAAGVGRIGAELESGI